MILLNIIVISKTTLTYGGRMSYYDSMAARSILEKATYVSVDKFL